MKQFSPKRRFVCSSTSLECRFASSSRVKYGYQLSREIALVSLAGPIRNRRHTWQQGMRILLRRGAGMFLFPVFSDSQNFFVVTPSNRSDDRDRNWYLSSDFESSVKYFRVRVFFSPASKWSIRFSKFSLRHLKSRAERVCGARIFPSVNVRALFFYTAVSPKAACPSRVKFVVISAVAYSSPVIPVDNFVSRVDVCGRRFAVARRVAFRRCPRGRDERA